MLGASFEAVTGRLGIGAIAFLGLFLVVDGLQVGVYELLETYGKSSTWGIVGLVPTTVIIYIVGVFCLGIAELSLSHFTAFHGPSPEDIVAVSRTGSSLLQQMYADYLRNHELLKGAAVSFIILAAGSIADSPNLRGQEMIVVLAVISAVAMSGLSLVFAKRAARQATDLARATHSSAEVATTH